MKNLKYFFILALVGMVFFSCNKNKKTDFTPENARQALNQASDIILTYVDDVKGSTTLTAAQSASNLGSSFKKAKRQVAVLPRQFKKLATVFKHTIHRKAKETILNDSGAFNMADYAGTYEWNKDSNDWVYDAQNPSDKIIVKFPATDASTSNNGVFTLSKYTEQAFRGNYGTWYQPTAIIADFYVDGTKSAALDLSISYTNNGDMPNHVAGTLFVDPFSFTLNYDLGDNNTITYSASIAKGQSTAFSSSATIVFADDTYMDVKTVGGSVQIANLKFTGNADIAAITAAVGDSNDDKIIIDAINANASASLFTYPEENKIGDLSLKYTTKNDIDVIITYSDGTTESAQPYFDKIQTSLNELFDEIDGLSMPDLETK